MMQQMIHLFVLLELNMQLELPRCPLYKEQRGKYTMIISVNEGRGCILYIFRTQSMPYISVL